MKNFDYLRDNVSYDQVTGDFVWVKNKKGVLAGTKAGTNCNGYVLIKIEGDFYYGHRLAWYFVHNEWPEHGIDHKDGNKSNNSIINLRKATDIQNSGNKGKNKNNTSGFKGVSFHKQTGKWRATLKRRHLGLFSTPENASERYILEAFKEYGEFAHVQL